MLPSPAAMTNSERNPTRPLFFHQSHGEPASKERILGEERVDTQIVVHSLIHAVVQHLFENHCVHHEPAILHRPATFALPFSILHVGAERLDRQHQRGLVVVILNRDFAIEEELSNDVQRVDSRLPGGLNSNQPAKSTRISSLGKTREG